MVKLVDVNQSVLPNVPPSLPQKTMKLHKHPPGDQKLINIIRHYKGLRTQNPDTWIEYAVSQKSLKDAIVVSSLCINHENKRHPHQYRIPQAVLEQSRDELLGRIPKIRVAQRFDDLYAIVSSLEIHGLGRLTAYDIANRIGAYKGIFPDRVYLHAGTKTGAKRLLGELSRDYLLKSDLPKPLRGDNLEYWEIEDILCIYKDMFPQGSGNLRKRRVC